MYLIYDTETTGFPNPRLEASHPAQCRMIQLAAIKLNKDFNEVDKLYTLIKLPQGKTIDEGAFKAHGISVEKCNSEGRELNDVLNQFGDLASTSLYHICHNKSFDDKVINLEYNTQGKNFYGSKDYCTMELMTPICKLPHKKRNSFGTSYKWPKLSEAYRFCFGKDFEGAHDAINDVRATAEIFRWLITNKYIKLDAGMVPA